MADKGIIFSAPMVRALLAGTKTQTRRLATFIKPHGDFWHLKGAGGGMVGCDDVEVGLHGEDYAPYAPGDRLYVRESALFWRNSSDNKLCNVAAFRADGYELEPGERWTPSIHMPRWASRLWLTVSEVRVQRLQNISEADCLAEGIDWRPSRGRTPSDIYAELWNSLHTEPGTTWDDNPWIVAVSFTVNRGNIDA